MSKKKKVLILADSPFAPSGIGTQTNYMIRGLLATGEYSFVCLAGAIKHEDYTPIKTEEYGEDLIVYPVDGYGSPELVRSMLVVHRPDVVWFMTDPRFWVWLWQMENEVRTHVPMVYYHVWDNYPFPRYNAIYYNSNDYVVAISKLTEDIVRNTSPEVPLVRIPHTVDTNVFRKMQPPEYEKFYDQAPSLKDKLVFFWNNRNARRKQSGTLIWWFKEYLDIVGKDKAVLLMHTEPKDEHGQDLESIIEELGITNGEVILSTKKMSAQDLARFYNIADCTINISDAEGFGLSTLESLSCETPIIVNMTGGLQEQVTDGEQFFGYGIEPASKAVIGSQTVPYIYEDRISKEDFLDVMIKFTNLTDDERAALGTSGRNHVLKNYSMSGYVNMWNALFNEITSSCGSWDTRVGYKPWSLEKL